MKYPYPLALLSLLLLAGCTHAPSRPDRAPDAARGCIDPNAIPLAIMGATETDFKGFATDRLPPTFDSFLFCLRADANGRPVAFELIDRQSGTPNKVVTAAAFLRDGYPVWRKYPIYGEVLATDFRCVDCDWSKDIQKMEVRLLHEFSLRGRKRSDYRRVGMTMERDEAGHWNMRYEGKLIHMSILRKGKWGVTHARISKCTGDVATCLTRDPTPLATVDLLDIHEARYGKLTKDEINTMYRGR